MKQRSSRKFDSAGFTLIELLLVALLIPLIAFAVYANFNSGVKIWQRLNQHTRLEDLRIFSQKVSTDFQSAFMYTPIKFEGDKESVSFAALIQSDEKLGGDRGIGAIRFFYDSVTQSIKREVKNANQIYQEKDGRSDIVLHGVSDWSISYLAYDKPDKAFKWLEAWEDKPKELPVAVRFEFNISGDSGSQLVKKTFIIPAGGPVEKV